MSVFACTDLHGMYDLYEQINSFLKPEDTVICLGDCGDRGPAGWKIIEMVAMNPQWLCLKGNHEDMLANAILNEDEDNEYYDLLCYNGGLKTYLDWATKTKQDKDWGEYLKSLPYNFTYKNDQGMIIYLSHAGFTPGDEPPKNRDLIWDRSHIRDAWTGQTNEIVIHGHTPTPYAHKGRNRPDLLRIEQYCDGHKYNLDLASWYTGVACLLDLDTFEEHYFLTEPI